MAELIVALDVQTKAEAIRKIKVIGEDGATHLVVGRPILAAADPVAAAALILTEMRG